MQVVIIEDEVLAQERLITLLNQYDESIKVLATIESIEDAIHWLEHNEQPDLFFMDIQLSDGFSFSILKKITITKPIIFTTAFDNYAIDAFKHFSIDYILKPITKEDLNKALQKYYAMAAGFLPNQYDHFINEVKDNIGATYKSRFLAKVGQRLFFVNINDISYFVSENKTVYVIDKDNNKFTVNNTIEKLVTQLDAKHFFRINRKVVISAEAIQQIKPYFNSRLQVHLKNTAKSEDFVISRDRVAEFKKWAEE